MTTMSHPHTQSETQPLLSHSPIDPHHIGNTNQAHTFDHHHHQHQHGSLDREEPIALRILAISLSFFVMGLIMSSIGLLIPHLESHYSLTDSQVSIIFTISPLGYIVATILTHRVHTKFGRRGIAVIGPVLQIVALALAGGLGRWGGRAGANYGVLVSGLAMGTVGLGLTDGAWCAWAGGMGGGRAGTVSGILHGSFSTGAGLGPFVGGLVMVAVGGEQGKRGGKGLMEWWGWYYVLAAASVLQLLVNSIAFRHDGAERYLNEQQQHQKEPTGSEHVASTSNDEAASGVTASTISTLLTHPAVLVCALFFLIEVGTESAISGWIVSYLLRAQHASPQLSASGSSAFWIGTAVGRVTLGMVTDRMGLRRSVFVYLLSALALSVAFGLASLANDGKGIAYLSVVLVAWVGFFCGPLFPSAIMALTRGLEGRETHAVAVTWVAMLGQVGGALLPVGIGLMIEHLGVEVFPGVIAVQILGATVVWGLFPFKSEGAGDGGVRGVEADG